MMFTEGVLKVLIYAFNDKYKPIYKALTNIGHKWYDLVACTCDDCLNWDEDDRPRNIKKKSSQQLLQEQRKNGESTINILGEPLGKFDYYVKYTALKYEPLPTWMMQDDHNGWNLDKD